MTASGLIQPDGHLLAVAIDHGLYSWPCVGLEDRDSVIRDAAAGGADAIIASYGTIRSLDDGIDLATILKLDLTTVSLGGQYPVSPHTLGWRVDDAVRLGAMAVLTFVQLGAPDELEALRNAALVAASADDIGMMYVCEIMPVESDRFPNPLDPIAIAAAVRTGSELGAGIVKTAMPETPTEISLSVAAGDLPVILAGGAVASDRERLFRDVAAAIAAGASGVAFGRNVWGASSPAEVVRRLAEIVHPSS